MNRIKEDMNLRQIDVAKQTGIDQRTLSNYETGKTYPDSYAIIKLAEFYGVSCDYLLGVSDIQHSGTIGTCEEIKKIRKQLIEITKALDDLEKHLK